MNKWSRFVGIVGLLVLSFGLAGWAGFGISTSPVFLRALIVGHVALGALLLVTWFAFYGVKHTAEAKGAVAGRSMRLSANILVYSLLFLAILTAVNWIGYRHKKSFDLTEEGVFSLAPQTRSVIDGLQKPLKIVAFKGNPQINDEEVRNLLERYSSENKGKVSTDFIDPRSRPHLVDTYQMKAGNLVYIQYGEGDSPAVSRVNEISEEAITNAVLKLARGAARKVYIIEGHDEPRLDDVSRSGIKIFGDALKDEHLNVEGLFLGQSGGVPQDASAVILIAPKRALPQSEMDLLTKYVDGGGSLFIMTDPRGGDSAVQLADHFGITVEKTLVVDLVQRLFDAPAVGAQIVARDYGNHASVKNFTADQITVFNIASSVGKKDDAKDGTYTDLVKTGQNAWGETDLAAVFDTEEPKISFGADDVKGPVTLGVAWEKKITSDAGQKDGEQKEGEPKFEKTSRVVVFGNSDWIKNGSISYYANRDLALNIISWLSGEEGGVTIRPRSMKGSLAVITKDQFQRILSASFIGPEIILLLGLIIWWKRRTRETVQ